MTAPTSPLEMWPVYITVVLVLNFLNACLITAPWANFMTYIESFDFTEFVKVTMRISALTGSGTNWWLCWVFNYLYSRVKSVVSELESRIWKERRNPRAVELTFTFEQKQGERKEKSWSCESWVLWESITKSEREIIQSFSLSHSHSHSHTHNLCHQTR